MGFGQVIQHWRRRRGLTDGLIAIALAGFLAAVAWLPRSYQAQASVALLPPLAASSVRGGSPSLSATPSIRQIAAIVSRELMSARTARQLAASGCTGSYVVGLDPDSAASSVLDVAVTGSSPAKAVRALHAVVARIGVALSQAQGRIRPGNRIGVAALSSGPQPTLAVSRTARPVIVVATFGLVVALGCPVVLDARHGRRRTRGRAGRAGRAGRSIEVPGSGQRGSGQRPGRLDPRGAQRWDQPGQDPGCGAGQRRGQDGQRCDNGFPVLSVGDQHDHGEAEAGSRQAAEQAEDR